MKPKLYVAIFLWVIFLKINVVLKQEELVLGPSSPIDCLQLKSSVCTPPLYYFHKSWIETPDVLEHFEYDAMLIKGYAKWDISPASLVAKKACDLPSTKQTPTIDVTIAESLPGKLKLSDDPALRFSSEDRGDYICLFVLGWSYILSVRLIDLHGKDSDDRVSYTGNLAESYVNGNKPESSRVAIDLNVVTEDHAELRWWTSVLADGEGWQAILSQGVSSTMGVPSSGCLLHSLAQCRSSTPCVPASTPIVRGSPK